MKLECLILDILSTNLVYLINIGLLSLFFKTFSLKVFWWFVSQEICSFHLNCWIYWYWVICHIFSVSPHMPLKSLLYGEEKSYLCSYYRRPVMMDRLHPTVFIIPSGGGKSRIGKKFHFAELNSSWFLFYVYFC